MKENFEDILSRIDEPPRWWDSNGTPRYGEFRPSLCPNIYARVVALMAIACQACARRFHVELHISPFSRISSHHPPKKWHYGDPPTHGCVGDSMNCIDIAALEVWTRESCEDWQRRPEFEGLVE